MARYLNDDSINSVSDGETDASETEDHLEVEYSEQTDEDDESLEVISANSSYAQLSVNFEDRMTSHNQS